MRKSNAFWSRQDAARDRRVAIARSDEHAPTMTDDERNAWLEAHGYRVGVSSGDARGDRGEE
jgi:hypothetical protein